jgi:hypothetical protein
VCVTPSLLSLPASSWPLGIHELTSRTPKTVRMSELMVLRCNIGVKQWEPWEPSELHYPKKYNYLIMQQL